MVGDSRHSNGLMLMARFYTHVFLTISHPEISAFFHIPTEMSFRGQNITDSLARRVQTVVWVKSGRDLPYLEGPIDDRNLELLSCAVALSTGTTPSASSGPKLAVFRVRESFSGKPSGVEPEVFSAFKLSVDSVVNALDRAFNVPIERVFIVSSGSRRECTRDSDIDIIVFIGALDQKESEYLSALQETLRKVASVDTLTKSGSSFFFTVGTVDICVTATPSIHYHPALQMKSAGERLEEKPGPLSERDKSIYACAGCECLEPFYQRFTRSRDAEFYLNLTRLVRLWKIRNIPRVPMNPLFLILLALKIAEHHVSFLGDNHPSLSAVLIELMQHLEHPEKIRIFFDTFSTNPGRIAESSKTTPALIDPTNDFNNLAETVVSWDQVKEAATNSLEYIKSRRSLHTLFPTRSPILRGG